MREGGRNVKREQGGLERRREREIKWKKATLKIIGERSGAKNIEKEGGRISLVSAKQH
jgi:hypothetical protein